METLNNFLAQFVSFNPNELDVFTQSFHAMSLPKGAYIAREGEKSWKLAFVQKGVMRAFFRNNAGKEYNKTFFSEGHFVGAYSSLITGQENLINIQCLTPCEVLIADYKEITKYYVQYARFEEFGRKIAEYKFVLKEKREIELVTLNASERYEIFKKEHAGLENRIPQYHIASYLGISATQLSRIRAKG